MRVPFWGLLLLTFFSSNAYSFNQLKVSNSPLNIILLIGDGMGPAHIKAYRQFKDDKAGSAKSGLVFDRYLMGSLSTDSIDQVEDITDSAASATAYATGQRTVNAALSVDRESRTYLTVLEKAKQIGLSTGLVATSEIVHATPAAFVSHHIDRESKNEIANQFFDNQFNQMPMVDILLGGGIKYLKRKDRDLTREFEEKGYQLLFNRNQLLNANSPKMLGLFADEGLAKFWDREKDTPSLAEMTTSAIEQLSKNQRGFFLMVEGSQIDWAAHANDIVGVMSEMEDFEKAVEVAIEFAKKHPNTLLIVTADHETGGLSIGSRDSGESRYLWDLDVIKSFSHTPAKIASDGQKSGDLVAAFNNASSLKLTENEISRLSKVNLASWEKIRRTVSRIISQRSFTGWTTHGHTGVDVPLYALGENSDALQGHWNNTKIGTFIFELLNQKEEQLKGKQ